MTTVVDLIIYGVPGITLPEGLDFSGLPNLPQSQRVAVEAAARTVDTINPQRVIDEIAKVDWLDFLPVSDNLQTSTNNPANINNEIQIIRSSSSALEGIFVAGNASIKTATGLSPRSGSYTFSSAMAPQMTFIVVSSNTNTTSSGRYYIDFPGSPRRVFALSGFDASEGRFSFYDGSTWVGASRAPDDGPHIFSALVDGTTVRFRIDGSETNQETSENTPDLNKDFILIGTSRALTSSDWRGMFYGTGEIDFDLLERFASAYYFPIDFSVLPNLPTAQQAAVEAAARTVDTINPQRVIALLAGSYWWHGLEVAANGQPVSSLSSWAQSRDLSSSGSNRPTQAANGLTFDGVDDYLDGGNSPLIPATGNFAAVFVLNKSSAEDAARIIFNQYYLSGAGRFQIFYLTSNNESRVFFSLDGGAGENILVSRDSFHLLSFGRNGNEGFIRVNTNGLTSDVTGASILQSGFLIGARTTSGSTYNQNLGFFFDGIVQGVLIDPSPTADVDRLERFASAYYGLSIIDFSGLPNLPVSSRPAVEIAVRTVDAINPQSVIDDLAQFQHWLSAALPDTLTRTGAEAISSWNDVIGSDNAVSDSGRSTDPTYVPAAGGNPAHVEFDGVNDGLIINSLLDLGGTSARTIVIVCKTSNNTVDSAIIQLNATDVGTASGRRYRITPEIAVRVFGAKVFNESLPSNHSVIVIQNPSNASASDMQGYLNGVALTQQALSDFPLNVLGSQTSIGFSLGLYGATDIAEILTSNTVISPATLNRISALLNALGSYGITLTSIV